MEVSVLAPEATLSEEVNHWTAGPETCIVYGDLGAGISRVTMFCFCDVTTKQESVTAQYKSRQSNVNL